ncbi:MAG: response regulator [candidate division NC10 bacterium]|nr:response regulator [candidate division NC10 bacterium]
MREREAGAEPPPKILVVDDVYENVALLDAYLSGAGYQVVKAYDGQEALLQAERESPDLILLDIMMPKLNGYEVCRKLKSDPRTLFIPIVMITALREQEERIKGIEAGADEFLIKPFNKQELMARVRSLLRVKALHDQVEASNRLLEQKVAERTAELQRALEELRTLDRMKTQFVSNISHELRTPLTPIMGYLGTMLQGSLGPLSPAQQRGLETIKESVERLHKLIDDLLGYVSMESSRLKLNRRQVHPLELLRQAWERALPLAKAKGQTLSLSIPEDLPFVWADPEELLRALHHLLENAIKFTPQGGSVTLAVQALSRSPIVRGENLPANRHQLPAIEISVSDTGPGIPEDQLDRIFDRFYQMDGSITREHGGMGIGLTIVKQILEAHGSRVEVESRPGQGCTFRFLLPVAKQNNETASG